MKDNRRDTLDGYPDILVLLDNYKYLNGGHPQGMFLHVSYRLSQPTIPHSSKSFCNLSISLFVDILSLL